MEKIGVTLAKYTLDIDSVACAISYAELLNLEGKEATAYIPESLNSSVTDEIKSWGLNYEKEPNTEDIKYVLVDTTDPHTFPKFISEDRIIEIYDHHTGYEEYWNKRIGNKAKIELIGACATLIWEEYKKRGFADNISKVSAKLLYAAIVSNTLNFKATITSPRDAQAFKDLTSIADLPKDWIQNYFIDQEEFIYKNPREAITNDIKIVDFPNLGKKITIGQMELWDSRKFVVDYKHLINEILVTLEPNEWFFNAPCISKGKNYVYSESDWIRKVLVDKFGVKFEDGIGETNRLIERKEFVKALQNL
ncbi:MAG: DHH family phosphoesterase [Patescibacteria group bacterium]